MRPSNCVLTAFMVTPSFLPTAFQTSTSKPFIGAPGDGKYSQGGYDASVATTSVPLLRMSAGRRCASGAVLPPLGVLEPLDDEFDLLLDESEPHPATTTAS